MNEKNIDKFHLWSPTAGLLQGLTVVQQCVYQVKFRNLYEVKKRLLSNHIASDKKVIFCWLCFLQVVQKHTLGKVGNDFNLKTFMLFVYTHARNIGLQKMNNNSEIKYRV